MDHVIYDFIGKLRVLERGYCFILIMVCVMTCFVFLKPLRTKSAKEVAFALVNVFANFGVPQILQSDNKQVMVADVLEELRKLGGFQLRRIMKYFPRQNGVVERFVQETKQVLLKWAKGDFSGWEYYIPAILNKSKRFKRGTQNWGKGGRDLTRSRGLMRRGGGILCKKWMGDC